MPDGYTRIESGGRWYQVGVWVRLEELGMPGEAPLELQLESSTGLQGGKP